MLKKFLILLGLCSFLLLTACATSRPIDQGHVIKIEKLANKSYAPSEGTAVGAGVGAGTGAAIGALAGGAAGTALMITTFGFATPLVPGLIAGGALAGGGMGAAAGGAAGYAKDVYSQGSGFYQFTVKPDDDKPLIIVNQPMIEKIELNDWVEVYVKKGNLALKKYKPVH